MTTTECVFCRIGAKQIPARVVMEDDEVLAFEDLHPQAPIHVLVIPKRHITALKNVQQQDGALLGHLLAVANQVARKKGIEESGYRVVANTGDDGGQTVAHLHLHVLGGRRMTWPPG
jgi:histidine triad (HIT) family protein